jgi:H+/Cl- antiporter ClcA
MDSFELWQILLLVLTAVVATFLSWIIVRIVYRKSRRSLQQHQREEENHYW